MNEMGKITVVLSDQLEERFRRFIAKNFPLKQYGMISSIVNEALSQFLDSQEKE